MSAISSSLHKIDEMKRLKHDDHRHGGSKQKHVGGVHG
jgi:hypothetical protein